MGKQKKGFNWKARVQGGTLETEPVDRLRSKVAVAGVDPDSAGYAGSNALAIPGRKLKFKKSEAAVVGRILSKKQRKRLEKIVDVKKKKEGRGSLLAALAGVQAPSLAGLEGLATAQTKGVKRQQVESRGAVRIVQTEGLPLHEVEGSLVKRKKMQTEKARPAVVRRDDVLGFTSESSSDSEEEDGDDTAEAVPDPPEDVADVDEEASTKITEAEFKPRPAEDPDDSPAPPPLPTSHRPAGLVPVAVRRPAAVEAARARLPVVAEEQVIMETIDQHGVLVLSGETGSGKTTQLPQFLYEAGYASGGRMVGVTEPRRVAAQAMSRRVGQELGLPASQVSYQIRYEGNVTEETKIKFMTDGVLLREVEKDFLLSKYSVIIIDEAHERSVFTDILIGLLSRIVPLRHKKGDPLKLVIMSATLRVSDFTENKRLFKTPPPVVNVESRQFPVTVHFNKHTREDYLAEAFRKVSKIHRELPEGGVLVFLTGQQEVTALVRRLRARFPGQQGGGAPGEVRAARGEGQVRRRKKKAQPAAAVVSETVLPDIDLSSYKIQPLAETEPDVMEDSDSEAEDVALGAEEEEEDGSTGPAGLAPLHVLPLYSLLSSERQAEIFAGAPPGSRLCVVATNVAETSLTIPGVKYVVDCGKVKTKHWDKVTGVTTFLVEWTSKAQANQRAGRAGRQGAGHAYRLYSSAVFSHDMKEFSVPEIQLRPVDDLLLQMKAMNISKVVNFPFPTCPDAAQLREAESRLQLLGALTAPAPGLPRREAEQQQFLSKVTPLGRAIAAYPLAPRFGKMLALAHQHGLLGPALSLVAALAVQEVLVERAVGGEEEPVVRKEVAELRRRWAGQGQALKLGDAMVLLGGLAAAERAGYCERWCASAGLRPKAVAEIRRLRRQLAGEAGRLLPGERGALLGPVEEPGEGQARLLAQLLLAGSPDTVARRQPAEEGGQGGAYRAGAMEQPAYIHPASVLRRAAPEWIVYQELFETAPKEGSTTGRVLMRGITEISPSWLPTYCPGLCRPGPALETPAPRYCPTSGRPLATYRGTFGPQAWPLPPTEQEMPPGADRFKWLGRFLLEGSVAPGLAQFASSLLSNPLIMVKAWSGLQRRTELVTGELAAAGVDSGPALARAWSQDPAFLLQAYLAWIPEVLHSDVKALWPPKVVPEN